MWDRRKNFPCGMKERFSMQDRRKGVLWDRISGLLSDRRRGRLCEIKDVVLYVACAFMSFILC